MISYMKFLYLHSQCWQILIVFAHTLKWQNQWQIPDVNIVKQFRNSINSINQNGV